jgi:hypothetical protein
MKRLLATSSIAILMTLALPAKASADLTGFFGLNATPKSRQLKGFAIGINVILIGFEFEFANTVEDPLNAAPSLKTYSFNGTIMTPTKTQLYVTAGGGLYRERLGTGSNTSFDTNIGGGIKMPLFGPIRLRLDYRIFTLHGTPLYKNPQRFYAGANISF